MLQNAEQLVQCRQVGGRGGGGGHDQHHVEIGKRRTDEAVPARQDVRENQPGAVGAGADAVRRFDFRDRFTR
ncbi:MAG: hypothetical protein BHW26_03195 [Faecalibacterium prausnitzii]|nr:MAG: hypothetical protein BHW26_03195 [Faecalibacterium prausnitzii]